MKKIRIILMLILIALFLIPSVGAMENKRSIFIGDIIELKVTSQNITVDELKNRFEEFDIVDIKDDGNSFLISVRSFEPGEKIVQIGDKEVAVNIKSTLDQIDRNDIFEGDLSVKKARGSIGFTYALYALTFIFLVTGIINLFIFFKRKKRVLLSPYQLFINKSKSFSLDSDDYLVKLTESFKEYIENTNSCLIKGKTSLELINEISDMPYIKPILHEITQWLNKSDIFKFSGVAVSIEDHKELLEKLIYIVDKIENAKEVET
ncbi:UNVERIFIED_CONTAM: hypothetical protein Cloal_3454 [Acetivibrio alkalicellulosi]